MYHSYCTPFKPPSLLCYFVYPFSMYLLMCTVRDVIICRRSLPILSTRVKLCSHKNLFGKPIGKKIGELQKKNLKLMFTVLRRVGKVRITGLNEFLPKDYFDGWGQSPTKLSYLVWTTGNNNKNDLLKTIVLYGVWINGLQNMAIFW